MRQIGCPETSARNYGSTLRHNPEERGSHLLSGGCLKSRILACLYQDYALQNRHDAETCALLGHYTANSGFTTTSRRKPEITHAWCSERAFPVSSAIREIQFGRFWTCRMISLLFVDIIYRLCLRRNLKHYVLWTRSVFDFVLSMNDGQNPIRGWLPVMQKGFCCVDTEWRGGRNVTVERLAINISVIAHITTQHRKTLVGGLLSVCWNPYR